MLSFDVELTKETLEEKVALICKEIKPNWSQQPDNKLVIKHLSGGITNCLYVCHLNANPWNNADSILFRIYGLNTEDFISRPEEMNTMSLMHQIGLGPKIFAKFKNGICYELLAGEILSTSDVYNEAIYTKVAESLAKMQFAKFQGYEHADPTNHSKYFLFPKMDKMYSLVKSDYVANMKDMSAELLDIIPSREQIGKEIAFVKAYLAEYTSRVKSLIVFSHNDLLLGNIIYNKEKDLIKFIDYEYGEMNYQAYDVANHFNEYAGVDNPDYSLFPSKKFQLNWLRVYLKAFYKLANEFHLKQQGYHQPDNKQTIVDDVFVEKFYEEVNKFTSASHLLWATWSLIQAQNSTIDFDFVKYAKLRFEQYFKHREQLV